MEPIIRVVIVFIILSSCYTFYLGAKLYTFEHIIRTNSDKQKISEAITLYVIFKKRFRFFAFASIIAFIVFLMFLINS